MTADAPVPTGALAAVAAVKDLGAFVVLVVGVAWIVWKVVPVLVAFLRSQERAMNAITVALTELRGEVRSEATATRAHVTAEATGGVRHPIKDAIQDVERNSIVRDAATLTKIGDTHDALATLIREEHKETRDQILRELARSH